MAYHVYFESELTDLTEEVYKHPDLMVKLVSQQTDIYLQIAEIAAHVGIVLEGTYTKEDVLEICTKLTEALRKKREIIVQPLEGG